MISILWVLLMTDQKKNVFSFFAAASLAPVRKIIASMRSQDEGHYQTYARQLLLETVEGIKSAAYTNIGTARGPESWFLKPHDFVMNETNPNYQKQDVAKPDKRNRAIFRVECHFKGFGQVAGATANTLAGAFPEAFPKWKPNEWVGRFLHIRKGPGRGQMACIIENDETTLRITTSLDGQELKTWQTIPCDRDFFEIDNGKQVEISVIWLENGQEQRISKKIRISEISYT